MCLRLTNRAIARRFIVIAAISAIISTSIYAQDASLNTLPVARFGERSFSGIQSLVMCDSSALLVTTDDIFLTTDNAVSWKELVAPLSHKSVVDVLRLGNDVYVLTANGAVHKTTNDGLTWNPVKRYKQGTVNTLAVENDSLYARNVLGYNMQAQTDKGAYTVSDSTISLRLHTGVTYTITSPSIREVSSVTVSDNTVFLGRSRLPVLAVHLESNSIHELDMRQIANEYISVVRVHDGFLYAGVLSGQGGIYRKPLTGNYWEMVNIDRNTESVDVQCITSSNKGLYIGFREHGVAYMPTGSHVAYPIHEGLSGAVAQTIDPYKGGLIVTARLRGLVYVTKCGLLVDRFSRSLPHSAEYVSGVGTSAVIVGLHDGVVIRSNDDGKHWDTLSIRFPESAINRIRCYDNMFLICTNEGVWSSIDTGTSWTRVFNNLPQQTIQDVHKTANGWVVRANEEAYVCNIDGSCARFSPVGTFEHNPHLLDVHAHGNTIYGVGYPGVFTSVDGGITWKTFTIAENPIIRSVAVFDNRVFITGIRGQIFYVGIESLK